MRALLRPLFLTLGLALIPALGACWVEPEQPYQPIPQTATPQPTSTSNVPTRVAIATGETLEAEPGKGAGVFVEYQAGGKWRVWTTCDTEITNTACHYQLSLQPEQGARLSTPSTPVAGSGDNRIDSATSSLISASLTTSTDTDSLEFYLDPPGASLQLQASLDGAQDGRIIFWIGPDVLHTGAPSNPVIFEPTTP